MFYRAPAGLTPEAIREATSRLRAEELDQLVAAREIKGQIDTVCGLSCALSRPLPINPMDKDHSVTSGLGGVLEV